MASLGLHGDTRAFWRSQISQQRALRSHLSRPVASVVVNELAECANNSHQARTSPLLNAARNYASEAKAAPTEVSSILEQKIRGVQEEVGLAETGRVLSVGYIKKAAKRQPANQWQ